MNGNPHVLVVVTPKFTHLGENLSIRRAVPTAACRSVGPFVFLDHMGPATLEPGQGLDVRPHPHIGLATLTWLFEGALVHRDSLGTVQSIVPGEVNWMQAGRGIAHSERSPSAERAAGARMEGMQFWVALPAAHEEDEPAFSHHVAAELPCMDDGAGNRITLVAGELLGANSPVPVRSPLFCAEVRLAADATLPVPHEYTERAVYVARGSVEVGATGDRFDEGQLVVLTPGEPVLLVAVTDCLLMLVGGEPLEGPRFVWWNFVSSRRERIEQAKADWEAGRFPLVPEEHERIPLPEKPLTRSDPDEAVAYP